MNIDTSYSGGISSYGGSGSDKSIFTSMKDKFLEAAYPSLSTKGAEKAINALAMVSSFLAGFAALAAVAGGVLAAATPIGWAALGLAAITVLVIACRHYSMEAEGRDPRTKDLLMDALLFAGGGFMVGALAPLAIPLGIFGGLALNKPH